MPRTNPAAVRKLLRAIVLGRRNDAIAALDDLTQWRGWPEMAADVIGPRIVDRLLEYRYDLLDDMEAIIAELRPAPSAQSDSDADA